VSETRIEARTASEAVGLVYGDRWDAYGPPEANLGRIAALWAAYLGQPVTMRDVCQMMVLMKISRSRASGTHDTFVDQVAYSLLAENAPDPH